MNPEYFMVDCKEKREGCEGQHKVYHRARKRTPDTIKLDIDMESVYEWEINP